MQDPTDGRTDGPGSERDGPEVRAMTYGTYVALYSPGNSDAWIECEESDMLEVRR